jgi:hypothetical protein
METMEEEDDESPGPPSQVNNQNPFGLNNPSTFDFSSGSTSTPTGVTNRIQEDGDTRMNDDPWLSMDLDSLLAQSLPPIDMSLYQSMGDLAPIHSDTVPYGQDDFSSYLYSNIGMNTDASSSVLQSTSVTRNGSLSLGVSTMTPVTPQVRAILNEFCESLRGVTSSLARPDDR